MGLLSLKDSVKINAYSSLLNTAIALTGSYRLMKPKAEFAHPPSIKSPLYNESYYFNFFNNKEDVSGFTWIGKLPNQKAVNATQILYVGRDRALVKFVTDSYPDHSDEIKCGSMRYEIIEPLKKIRIISTGSALLLDNTREVMDPADLFMNADEKDLVDVQLDCVFDGYSPVHNSKRLYARSVAVQMAEKGFGLKDLGGIRKIAANHYEQSGSYTGTLKIGDRTIDINTIGHRDHSWGIRDWHAPERWTWLSVEFGKEAGLNLCRIVIGRVDLFLGYITRGGRNYPLKAHELETQFESDGRTQKRIGFRIEDTGGFIMEVTGNAVNVVHLTKKENGMHVIVNEALTEYTWNGRTSFGVSEYLHKIS